MAEAEFEVFGPVSVPIEKMKKGRIVDRRALSNFWKESKEVAGETGCYVFGMSSAGGLMPWYVGKATKRFQQECFTPHKENAYNQSLTDYARGRPVMFFIVAKSRGCQRFIDDVETFLIQMGVDRNPKLRNDRKTQPPKWHIQGVIRGEVRRTPKAAQSFKRIMGL